MSWWLLILCSRSRKEDYMEYLACPKIWMECFFPPHAWTTGILPFWLASISVTNRANHCSENIILKLWAWELSALLWCNPMIKDCISHLKKFTLALNHRQLANIRALLGNIERLTFFYSCFFQNILVQFTSAWKGAFEIFLWMPDRIILCKGEHYFL